MFTRVMRFVGKYLLKATEDSADYYFNKMENNTAILHNSQFCIVDIIDISQNKVVAFKTIDKYNYPEFKNFDGVSNLMEATRCFAYFEFSSI